MHALPRRGDPSDYGVSTQWTLKAHASSSSSSKFTDFVANKHRRETVFFF